MVGASCDAFLEVGWLMKKQFLPFLVCVFSWTGQEVVMIFGTLEQVDVTWRDLEQVDVSLAGTLNK